MRPIRSAWLLTPALVGLLSPSAWADEPKPPTLATGTLDTQQWLKYATTPLQRGEIDRLVQAELSKVKAKSAAIITDEQFVRRLVLDAVGRPPTPTEMSEFLANKKADRRAELIDRLLDSDDFARHWARYWRNVVTSRQTDFRAQVFAVNFENWLTEQLRKNRRWGVIVNDMLTAGDMVRLDNTHRNGQAFFIATRIGADGKTELAAETSRIFLGMQIQCAQCHNHPSDVWKRQDFHEFAAYFARVRSQPFQENKKLAGLKIVSVKAGEHQMPNKDDPKSGTVIHPRFLHGGSPGQNLGDLPRRRALAASIISQNNPWFAAAYVNRIWGELMGEAFCMPIDDMGPQKEVIMPDVLGRLAGSFRGSAYDTRQFFRAILNSDVYRRAIRPGENQVFAAAGQTTRLQADTLWHSLVAALGPIASAAPKPGHAKGPQARLQGLENFFKREFSFDPSAKQSEVEGSVSQALLLMNNPQINKKIQAKGDTALAKILTAHARDDEAITAVYQQTLARQPSEREMSRCKEYLQSVGNRAEAFEDILWTLVNSTEFQTRR